MLVGLVGVYMVEEYEEYMNVENIIEDKNDLKLVVSFRTPESRESGECV
jgi:hypothetical protein